jgi:poly-gamma-glutamate capsule biosynthesis protein CapA/YwtB (metallophosphatase superfamily)
MSCMHSRSRLLPGPDLEQVAAALGASLTAAVVAFWGVVAFHHEKPYRPVIVADSIPTPAAAEDLPSPPPGGLRIRLGFAGDLMQFGEQRNDDFRGSYALVAPHIRSLDLAVGNLEFPVDSTLPAGPDPGTVRFNGSPAHLDAIVEAGFDVAQTANNHTYDRGLDGLLRTLASVRARGLRPVGTDTTRARLDADPVLVEVKGVRLAFRAYSTPPNTYLDPAGRPGWVPCDVPMDALDFEHWRDVDRAHGQALFRSHVAQARAARAGLVIAMVHWGRQYYLAPSADQRRAAHDLVDAGYDLVIGTHSHVLVPPELYRGRLIAYSLGNFLSQTVSPETSVGAVLDVDLVEHGGRVVVAGFRYRATEVRLPGHVVTPIDSTRSSRDAAAWAVARRVLGRALVPWDSVVAQR